MTNYSHVSATITFKTVGSYSSLTFVRNIPKNTHYRIILETPFQYPSFILDSPNKGSGISTGSYSISGSVSRLVVGHAYSSLVTGGIYSINGHAFSLIKTSNYPCPSVSASTICRSFVPQANINCHSVTASVISRSLVPRINVIPLWLRRL